MVEFVGLAVSVVELACKCLDLFGRSKTRNKSDREEKRREVLEEESAKKSSNTQDLPKDDNQSPHPRVLYERELDENADPCEGEEAPEGSNTARGAKYKQLVGGFCGIVYGLLLVWELDREPEDGEQGLQNALVKTLKQSTRWSGITSALEVREFLGFRMVGYDKWHAHPTAVFSVLDDTSRAQINSELRSLMTRFRKFGYLVLDTNPSFLQRPDLTSRSQSLAGPEQHFTTKEYVSVYLATNQTNRMPPCEVELFDALHHRCQKSTIGGIFWDGKRSFAFIIIDHTLGAKEEDPEEILHQPHSTQSPFAYKPTTPKLAPISSLRPAGKLLETVEIGGRQPDSAEWVLVSLASKPRENIIQIPNSFGAALTVKKPADKIVDGPVYIVIGTVTRSHGVLTGSLIISKGSGTNQYQYRIQAYLEQYDCGSWVIDIKTGSFLGVVQQIFENSDGLLLPAKQLFKMISDRGKTLSLPDSDSPLARAYNGPVRIEDEERSRMPPTQQPEERSAMKMSVGPSFGKLGKDNLWEITGTYKRHWNALLPQIEDILRRTPSLSQNETAPLVLLEGFMAGSKESAALPTVVVTCSSETYATQLQKALRHSGVLKRYNFQMKMVKYPVQRHAESRAPLQTV